MKKFPLTLSALAPVALLAACGGGSEEPAASDTAAPAEATEETATTEPAAATAPAADNTETVDGTILANFTGDAAAGEKIFLQCKSCHVIEPGQNRIGPSLAGIVGRAAGSVEGFSYTEANANSGITWTREKMFQYLEDPMRVIPGTKMAFAGLKDAQDRADVIAYLETAAAQ
ncbi:c-type cytochrome [Altererythrobacter sp. GH1-8]|uniref:c-type cytochrome n=1 Tax=Altererythrobacter sp. GH1-8 TaxID=3349333 RepID=UPI00374CF8B7